jgi:hypothetical protein
LVKDCAAQDSAATKAQADVYTNSAVIGNQQGAQNNCSGLAGTSGGWAAAADHCKQAIQKCTCGDSATQNRCKQILQAKVECLSAHSADDGSASKGYCDNANARASDQKPQSTDGGGGSSGGGLGNMGTGLLMAAAGGLLAYMMTKKKDKKDDGAFSNGQLDCSKSDAAKYQPCADGYLSQTCLAEVSAGTYASDSKCTSLASVYCASTGAASVLPVAYPAPETVASGGAPTQLSSAPPQTAPGSGVGTPFCQAAIAYNYCQSPGRGMCPSCLGLNKTQSPACAANPALCLAQNSQAQITAAKATCPTDPMFANPAYAVGGGSVATGLNTSGASLPVVVLPQSTDSASGSALQPASVEDSSRAPASASGLPSDIQGQFGPSLFAMTAQSLQARCAAGKLNHCP